MKLVSLNKLENKDNSIQQLSTLFYEYFKERHNDVLVGDVTTSYCMIKDMLATGNMVYYLEDKEDIVAFITISVNNQYGMVQPVAVVDYMYIKPSYRGGRATALMFGCIGHVATTLEMDVIGTTFLESSNINNASVVEAEPLAMVYSYKREAFKERYKKYLNKYL